MKLCKCGCNGKIPEYNIKGEPRNYMLGHNSKGKFRDKSHNWKGGRYLQFGYWLIYMPDYFSAKKNGSVLEHVYEFQELHKCCMLPWGDVHHSDGNKQNNLWMNLEGMLHSEHSRMHTTGRRMDMSGRICQLCKSATTYIDKNKNHHWYKHINGFICKKCAESQHWKKKMMTRKSTG